MAKERFMRSLIFGRSRVARIACFLSVFSYLIAPPVAQATNLYWDTNTAATVGAATTNVATGAWNGVANNWNTDPTGFNNGVLGNATTSSDDLFFAAGTDATSAYTVTLSGIQS